MRRALLFNGCMSIEQFKNAGDSIQEALDRLIANANFQSTVENVTEGGRERAEKLESAIKR